MVFLVNDILTLLNITHISLPVNHVCFHINDPILQVTPYEKKYYNFNYRKVSPNWKNEIKKNVFDILKKMENSKS